MLSKEQRSQIVTDYQKKMNDTGSTEVQVALLSARIKDLEGHFRANPKDLHSRRGLTNLVARRRKLLKYLKRQGAQTYYELLNRLNIRG